VIANSDPKVLKIIIFILRKVLIDFRNVGEGGGDKGNIILVYIGISMIANNTAAGPFEVNAIDCNARVRWHGWRRLTNE